ncbi:MAG: LytR/AlgR family response regulator transcription factor [Janthinobacterium lividum]
MEDEAVLALQLRTLLEAEGYGVTGTARTGPQALALAAERPPDLVLCDIHLAGPWDGIETAARLVAQHPVPLIYLTAMADADTLARALATGPAAYLTKPATPGGLRAAITLALHQFARQVPPAPDATSRDTLLRRDDYVFIKHLGRFVRLPLAEVLLLEADNTCTTFLTAERKYVLRLPLSTVLERLQWPELLRVHRSYALNLRYVSAFTDSEATVGEHAVPIGRQYKPEFLRQFNFC